MRVRDDNPPWASDKLRLPHSPAALAIPKPSRVHKGSTVGLRYPTDMEHGFTQDPTWAASRGRITSAGEPNLLHASRIRNYPRKRPHLLPRSTSSRKENEDERNTRSENGYSDRFDYEKRYPEDEPWEEREPNARVWRVYLDESGEYDIDMVENYKDTIDVILVFAGLFSAVVTTLAVQASTNLQPDYSQVMASILLQQLSIQQAIANGEAIPKTSKSSSTLDFGFSASSPSSSSDRWVSGLWFTSLTFSLATALIGVLVKQWIQAYSAPVSGTPRTRARLRQYRFTGLYKWHVPLIIGLLPTLLHLSLLLFLLGLVVFLFDLDHVVASVVASITCLVYGVYLITNLLPIFDPQCPYKTPLSTYAYAVLSPFLPPIQQWSARVMEHCRRLRLGLREQYSGSPLPRAVDSTRRALRFVASSLKIPLPTDSFQKSSPPQASDSNPRVATIPASLRTVELSGIEAAADEIDATMLCWLTSTSSNPSVSSIVVKALSTLTLGYPAKDVLREGGALTLVCSAFRSSFEKDGTLLPEHDRSYRLSECTWAHISLGLTFDSAGFPALRCPAVPESSTQPDPSCACHNLYVNQRADAAEGYRWAGVVYSQPAPNDVLRLYYSVWRPRWLFKIRDAALYCRLSLERPHQDVWIACYSLFLAIPLDHTLLDKNDAEKNDVLKQVLTSIYLSSLFVRPTPTEPAIIRNILLDEASSALLKQRREIWLVSFGFRSLFLSAVLLMFNHDPSAVKLEWWTELLSAFGVLANSAQECRGLLDSIRCDPRLISWLSDCFLSLFPPFVTFLGARPMYLSYSPDSLLPLVDLAVCAIRLEPTYIPHLSVIFADFYPMLLRHVVLDLKWQATMTWVEPPVSKDRLAALCKLLYSSSRYLPKELSRFLRDMDILTIFEHIFSQRNTRGVWLAECADLYIRISMQGSLDQGTQQEELDSGPDTEYLFKHLNKVCVWYMASNWDPQSALAELVRRQPDADCWAEIIVQLRNRDPRYRPYDERKHESIFIDDLEGELKDAKHKQQNPPALVKVATFVSLAQNQPIRRLGRRVSSAVQGLFRHVKQESMHSSGEESAEPGGPTTELELRSRFPNASVREGIV